MFVYLIYFAYAAVLVSGVVVGRCSATAPYSGQPRLYSRPGGAVQVQVRPGLQAGAGGGAGGGAAGLVIAANLPSPLSTTCLVSTNNSCTIHITREHTVGQQLKYTTTDLINKLTLSQHQTDTQQQMLERASPCRGPECAVLRPHHARDLSPNQSGRIRRTDDSPVSLM